MNVVILSGAGISTDSGIQDFRGPAGYWTLNPGAPRKHTYQAFLADAALRALYWESRYSHPVWQASPNAGHYAVASLSATVVTQNTDGLHQLAGSPPDRVIELHGTMHTTVCVACGDLSETVSVVARVGAGEADPPCLRCGGILKTASTMFGQTMAPSVFARAREAVTSCDLLIAVGTTLTVEPAGSLCAQAVRAGASLVIVNWDPTPYDGIATEIIRDPLSEALPRIVQQLQDGTFAPVGVPSHTPALVAGWLWGESLPDPAEEALLAAALTPRLLMTWLMEAGEEQERQALSVLARAAETYPSVRTCLIELLSVLPGLSPAAVEVALYGEHPAPLAEALTALARTAALPAELLEAVPPGTTVLGEFPVLLAADLVGAYERRLERYPDSAPRGLAKMLIDLSGRLADLGRAEEALAAARRAVQVGEQFGIPVRAEEALRRAGAFTL